MQRKCNSLFEIVDWNQHMNRDKLGRLGKHWPPQLVFHHLKTSINNAFQLYKAIPADTQKLTSGDFGMTLATNLMIDWLQYNESSHRPTKERSNYCTETSECRGPYASCWSSQSLCCLFSYLLSSAQESSRRK